MTVDRCGPGNPMFGKTHTEEATKKWRISISKTPCPTRFKSGPKELHPKWIADRSKVQIRHHNDDLARRWRTAVLARDGRMCRIANKDCNGRLETHHILTWKDYPELRYEINNGITLCHAHHPRKEKDVVMLAQKFQEIVAST